MRVARNTESARYLGEATSSPSTTSVAHNGVYARRLVYVLALHNLHVTAADPMHGQLNRLGWRLGLHAHPLALGISAASAVLPTLAHCTLMIREGRTLSLPRGRSGS